MPKKSTPSFAFNDETQENSYGFSIPNDGVDLTQFEANPVMLNSHDNSTESVIGRWENVRVENSQLLGDPIFDTEDEEAKKIEGKVSRGFLKAVSMGLGFYMEDLKYISGKLFLTKCVLKEVSIVAIPSNSKALRLYDLATGKLFEETELQLQLSHLQQNTLTENKNQHMKQIMLSATVLVALGLAAQPADEAALDAAIVKLKGDYEAEKAGRLTDKTAADLKIAAAELKLKETLEIQNKAVLDEAVDQGKITTEERADFADMPLNVLVATFAKIPAKVTLSTLVNNKGGKQSIAKEPATFEELMKLSDDEKTAFKNANPTAYAKLVDAD